MPEGFDWNRAGITSRRNLPHLRQANVVYFITFRLSDSVPEEKLRQWQVEYERLVERATNTDESSRHRLRQMERYLDSGHGECLLQKPDIAAMVSDALRHFDGNRYLLDCYVVMPNHVHALVCPIGNHELSRILHSWKSYTANQINRILGRTGKAVWQRESFDHIVRDLAALARFRDYIRRNPAKLAPGKSLLGQGEFTSATGM